MFEALEGLEVLEVFRLGFQCARPLEVFEFIGLRLL